MSWPVRTERERPQIIVFSRGARATESGHRRRGPRPESRFLAAPPQRSVGAARVAGVYFAGAPAMIQFLTTAVTHASEALPIGMRTPHPAGTGSTNLR